MEDIQIYNRIRKIRLELNFTQEQMADKLGMKRTAYAKMEGGSSHPSIETIKKIVSLSGKSYDWIIEDKYNHSDENRVSQFNDIENKDIYNIGDIDREIEIIPIVVDMENVEWITLVHENLTDNYHEEYQNKEYIAKLPVFRLPFIPKSGIYRAFQVFGNSMEPTIHENDILISKKVINIKKIQSGCICIIVLKDNGILCRRIDKGLNNYSIRLIADNSNYEILTPSRGQIVELWKVDTIIRKI